MNPVYPVAHGAEIQYPVIVLWSSAFTLIIASFPLAYVAGGPGEGAGFARLR